LAGEGRRCGAVQWALGSGSLALSLSAAGGVAAPTTERAERNRQGFPPTQVGGRFGRWGWAETEAQWPTPHPHRTRHGNGVGWDCGAQQQHAPEHACGQTSLTLAAHRSPLDSAGRRLMRSSLVSGVWWSSMQRCCHSRSFLYYSLEWSCSLLFDLLLAKDFCSEIPEFAGCCSNDSFS